MSGYYSNSREDVLNIIPNSPKNVLELGCGEGTFGKLLKQKFNCEVTGIDISERAIIQAKKNIDCVYKANIDKFDFSQLGKFDLIVANDCLEHLLNPWEVVENLKDNLTENGYFISSIPNIRHYYILNDLFKKGTWNYTDSGLLDKTHLRFFTKNKMISLFEDNKYIVDSITPTNVAKVKNLHIIKVLLKLCCPDLFALQFVVVAKKSPA